MNQADSKNSRPALVPGVVVAGKYRVESALAKGAMGHAVAATDLLLGRRVALKLLRGGMGSQPEAVSSFSRDARSVAQLQSAHVGRVLDAGVTSDGNLYVAREYFEDDSLARKLALEGPFDAASAADYAIQTCEGLAEAHSKGIVHGDIKPDNLFWVERTPGRRSIQIVDFGASTFAFADPSNVVTSAVIGCMSPEQLQSASAVDHRSDIWSLGATLHHLLTGRAAFDTAQTLAQLVSGILDRPVSSAHDLRPEVPVELAAVVTRCLAKERGARFQSMGELAMALLPFAPESARAAAERAASMTPAPRDSPSPLSRARERVAPVDQRPPRPAAGQPAPRRENGPSLAPVSRTLFGVGEAQTPKGRAVSRTPFTRTLFGVGEPRVPRDVGPSRSPTRTLFGLGTTPTPLAMTTHGHLAPGGPDAEAMLELPRQVAPRWLGIAAMSAAGVVVFLAILFAAPDSNDKGGTAARPSPSATVVRSAAASAEGAPIPPTPAAPSAVVAPVVSSPPATPKDVPASPDPVVNIGPNRHPGDVSRAIKPVPSGPSWIAPTPGLQAGGNVESPIERGPSRPVETRDPGRVP